MTWTVTHLGSVVTSVFATPVTSLVLTPSPSIAIGDGVAVFVQYTDFQADAIALTDNASPPNTYVGSAAPVDNLVDAGTGQALASFYLASAAHTATTITASFGSAVIQSMAAIKFTNSVAGTPTLDGHHGFDNSVSTTTPNSGAGNATNGDLVLTGIISNGPDGLGDTASVALAITGVTTPTIQNNQNTVAGYADGSGVTTTTGNATSTWTLTLGNPDVVLEMIFKPPAAAALCKGLASLGAGCWIAAQKLEENPILTRRSLIMPSR